MCVAAAKTPANLPKKYIHMVKEEPQILVFSDEANFFTRNKFENKMCSTQNVYKVCVYVLYNVTSA